MRYRQNHISNCKNQSIVSVDIVHLHENWYENSNGNNTDTDTIHDILSVNLSVVGYCL
jgi:hypothetical protein